MAGSEVGAGDVAAELRRRLPGFGIKKLHQLLYYCQGHHLAAFGRPLFRESIAAWDMGPVVGSLWKREQDAGPVRAGRRLGQAELNTIGYVLSRYGALTGRDLEILTHGETPWQSAIADRRSGAARSTKISLKELRDFFQSEDDDSEDPTRLAEASAELDELLRGAPARARIAPGQKDDLASLRRRRDELSAVRSSHC